MAAQKSKTAKKLKKVWKVATTGSPVCVDGDVVYSHASLKGRNGFVAFERKTGHLAIDGPGIGNIYSVSTAAVTGTAVVVGAKLGTRIATVLDRQSGALRFELNGPDTNYLPGAIVFDEIVICVAAPVCDVRGPESRKFISPLPRGRLIAFSVNTGAQVYDVELPEGMTPDVAFAASDLLVVGMQCPSGKSSGAYDEWLGRILVFRPSDGSLVWQSEMGLAANVGGDGVIVADARGPRLLADDCAQRGIEPNELVVLDAKLGTVRFRRSMHSGYRSFTTPERIICIQHQSDAAIALDIRSGEQLWTAGNFAGAPSSPIAITDPRSGVVCGGRLWFQSSSWKFASYDLEVGDFAKTTASGFQAASDSELLFIADSSSLTAYSLG